MTYVDAIQFLYGLRWFGAKFGLASTFKLAALAGNPQERLRFIHVAGTNGKGSTCAMLESVYRAAGLRVGLFTSPHLVSFSERIQVNRRNIPDADVVKLVIETQDWLREGWAEAAATLAPPVPIPPGLDNSNPGPPHNPNPHSYSALRTPHSALEDHPTFFEVVTVMALRYFAAQNCDLVVWETGLGGRLDATNIVTPLASVITNIQFDHQKYLGETLASIAWEKSGIIKPGVPVVTGVQTPEALSVIENTARRQNAPLTRVQRSEAHGPPLDTLPLPLLGQHQKMNAAVALAAVRDLNSLIPIRHEAIHAGLSSLHWPGRLQLVTRPSGRQILLDGAHNIGGAETLAAALKEYFPSSRPALVLGILQDKDWPAMCELLAPLAGRILLVPVHSERTAQPHGLAEVCHQANPAAPVTEHASLSAALAEVAQERFITIAGSLYLIGEAMELLQLSPANGRHERALNEWKL